MKYRAAILIVLLVILVDQVSKFYVKTHFFYGEEIRVLGSWFRLHFIENEGMAFGMRLGEAATGKLVLTLFRLVAVVFGFFLLKKLVVKKYTRGLIICGALVLAGACGNLIDSMFYGLIFTDSPYCVHYSAACETARLVAPGQGYGQFLYGKVVDMLYFPLIETRLPEWVPFRGGETFEFFEPVFNIADAAISVGVLVLVFFQKKLVRKQEEVAATAAGDRTAEAE